MPVATLAQLLDAVRDQLKEALSTEDLPIHVESGLFRAAETPTINVYPAAPSLVQDFAAFGNLVGQWPMAIRVAVSPADIEAGEALLWAFMDDTDPLSIIAALDSDSTLGGVASDVFWGDWGGYQDITLPDVPGAHIGSTLPILVVKAES